MQMPTTPLLTRRDLRPLRSSWPPRRACATLTRSCITCDTRPPQATRNASPIIRALCRDRIQGCEPEAFDDALSYDAVRFGWAQVGRDIARFADGFVLVDVDGTMTNLHARAAGQPHYLDILGDRVKFRREAGTDGAIIAMLDMGTLPGAIDPTRWTVTRDGVQWTPVVVQVPDMGKVREVHRRRLRAAIQVDRRCQTHRHL